MNIADFDNKMNLLLAFVKKDLWKLTVQTNKNKVLLIYTKMMSLHIAKKNAKNNS